MHRKLFVVQRGNPGPGVAAVQVNFNGEDFFIPKPRVGALDEERSLQVLDLVSTALTMVTTKDSPPKANTVSLIAVRSEYCLFDPAHLSTACAHENA